MRNTHAIKRKKKLRVLLYQSVEFIHMQN
uniref:Uncharacterized protein n=1 Tax=Rhizophora mucronata TaxID=61149 RepID=A0A2P2PUT1_RHIMU